MSVTLKSRSTLVMKIIGLVEDFWPSGWVVGGHWTERASQDEVAGKSVYVRVCTSWPQRHSSWPYSVLLRSSQTVLLIYSYTWQSDMVLEEAPLAHDTSMPPSTISIICQKLQEIPQIRIPSFMAPSDCVLFCTRIREELVKCTAQITLYLSITTHATSVCIASDQCGFVKTGHLLTAGLSIVTTL